MKRLASFFPALTLSGAAFAQSPKVSREFRNVTSASALDVIMVNGRLVKTAPNSAGDPSCGAGDLGTTAAVANQDPAAGSALSPAAPAQSIAGTDVIWGSGRERAR